MWLLEFKFFVYYRFHNKTVLFIGDSLGKQQFESFLCMIDPDKAIPVRWRNVRKKFGFYIPEGKRSPNGHAIHFLDMNLSVVLYGSVSLCEVEALKNVDAEKSLNGSSVSANNYSTIRETRETNEPPPTAALHLDRVDPKLKFLVDQSDFVIYNSGHHWTK